MSPAPVVDQFPKRPVCDRLTDPPYLGDGHMQVVEGEEAEPFGGREEFCRCIPLADRARAGEVREFFEQVAAMCGQVPTSDPLLAEFIKRLEHGKTGN